MSRTHKRALAMGALLVLILPGLMAIFLMAPTGDISSSIGIRQDGKNLNGLNAAVTNAMTATTTTTTISTITFAGRMWDVSGYGNFVNIAQQVWVDSNGYLHMKLSKDSGSWKDVEIVSRDVTGYGTYTWVTDGVKNIDKNIVLGMFPYLDNSHEVDQEISRWGDANSPNFAYTVQPDPVKAGVTQQIFELPTTTLATTFTTTWTSSKIMFSTMEGSTTVGSFTSNVARDATGVHALINLWQFSGAPSDGNPVEVVFKDFQFTPVGASTSTPTSTATPTPSSVPGTPTSVAVSQSLGKTTLTWAAPASNGGSQITSYKVFRGTTSNIAGQVQIGSTTTTSYSDTQVTAGQTYYYSVKAVNSVGDSTASKVVSVLIAGSLGTSTWVSTSHGYHRWS